MHGTKYFNKQMGGGRIVATSSQKYNADRNYDVNVEDDGQKIAIVSFSQVEEHVPHIWYVGPDGHASSDVAKRYRLMTAPRTKARGFSF